MSLLSALPMEVTPITPPGVEEKIDTLLGWLMWIGGAAAIAGFMLAGIMLVFSNNSGQSNEAARWVARVSIGAVLIAGAAALANFITGQ